MPKIRQTISLIRILELFAVYTVIITIFCGCAAEENNPLAVEKLNGAPPKQELLARSFDARGIVNGKFYPGDTISPNVYPIRYTGDWGFRKMTKSQWYMAISDTPDARIDIVATMSRVVFDFWDYEMYDNPGRVRFEIDGQVLGTFELARDATDGMKYLNYQVTTQKNTVATVSMIIESGRAVVTGYLINALDSRYPY